MNTQVKMPDPIPDDATLIAAARRGDLAGLEALVRKHQSAVFALALSRVGNATAAEEKEVTTMARKNKCGCGCIASSKGSAKRPNRKRKARK